MANPRLLLMDEPLSALDAGLKAQILPYIERLRDQAGIPIVYVSHSVTEVARLATTVVILSEGRVTAVGPVLDILPLADAGDAGSVLDATVARHDEAFQLTVLASAAGELQVPRLAAPVGSAVRAYIRARDVMISLRPPEEISALNVLPGRIAAVAPDANGAQADVRLDCNGAVLSARLTAKSVHRLALAIQQLFQVIEPGLSQAADLGIGLEDALHDARFGPRAFRVQPCRVGRVLELADQHHAGAFQLAHQIPVAVARGVGRGKPAVVVPRRSIRP